MDNKELIKRMQKAIECVDSLRDISGDAALIPPPYVRKAILQELDYEREAFVQAIHSLQFQSAGGHWVPFAERWPNQSPALDNPDVKATDTVLVTNNINARDRMGRMSHVWYAAPIESSNGGVVAYDNGDRKIEGLTHWFDPLAATQPKEVELVSRDERARARNALLDLIIRVYRHGRTSECCTREEAIDAVNTLTLAATRSLQSQEAEPVIYGLKSAISGEWDGKTTVSIENADLYESSALLPLTYYTQPPKAQIECHLQSVFSEGNKRAILEGELSELHRDCSVCGEVFVLYKENDALKVRHRDCAAPAKAQIPDKWLIWSNEHASWWMPNSRGYTNSLKEAGRYNKEVARKICEDAGSMRFRGGFIPCEIYVASPELEAALLGATQGKESELLLEAMTCLKTVRTMIDGDPSALAASLIATIDHTLWGKPKPPTEGA